MDKFSDYKPFFRIDLTKIVNRTLQLDSVKRDIIEFNQKEQLQEGIDANGLQIYTIASQEQGSGVYARMTIAERSSKGLQTSKVDLKDTGAFYNTFNVEVNHEGAQVLADFSKGGNDIRDNFDSFFDFLGLNPETLENFVWLSFYEPFSDLLLKEFQD